MGYIGKASYKWGLWSASNPAISILLGISIALLAIFGFLNYEETVRLKCVRNCLYSTSSDPFGFNHLHVQVLRKHTSMSNLEHINE